MLRASCVRVFAVPNLGIQSGDPARATYTVPRRTLSRLGRAGFCNKIPATTGLRAFKQQPDVRVGEACLNNYPAEKEEVFPAMPIVNIVEPDTNRKLTCMLRRRFQLASGEERCLLLPLDHPVDVLRGEGLTEDEDLSDIGDSELAHVVPDMALALSQKGLLLQRSAFCMTVRGAVRFCDEDLIVLDTGLEGVSEGIEIATFQSGGSHYLVYAPANPMVIVTMEDPETQLHTIVFEDEVDDAAFENNMKAVLDELTDNNYQLFEV